MKKKVLITYFMPGDGYDEIRNLYDVTIPSAEKELFSYDEVMDMIDDYDALLPMFNFRVDRNLMERGRCLSIVSNYAVGFDNIDVQTATELGIQVTNTPDPVTEPTADQAMGLLLALSRRISEIDRRVRIPGSVRWGLLENLGHSLQGKTMGILGMGRIGRALARRAKASGMKVIYHNRHRLAEQEEMEYDTKYVSFDELVRQCDVLSVNAPLTQDTYHIIDEHVFKTMKSTAYLINTARGPLVDEKALIAALHSGEIAGAGLDVFEFGDNIPQELLVMDNVVVNPHLGTQTHEVRNEMAAYAARNIINFFEGNGHVARVNNLDSKPNMR